MEEEKHLNIKKVTITVAIFIFAFLIILGSALLTKHVGSNKKEKNLEIKEPDQVKITSTASKEENIAEEKLGPLENVVNEMQNQINNVTETNTTTVSLEGKLPVANPNAITLCKQAQTSQEHNIYLTFDDGPSPNVTPQILDILEQYQVPATFFVLGSRAELYPELIRQEYQAGHYIANHGYTHQYSAIYASVQTVIDEYNSTEKAVQDALGNPNYHTLLFRFPGGSSGGPYDSLKQQAKSTLEEMGIASTNWNCLNGDAEGGAKTKEELLKRLYDTAASWDSLVVLMHDSDDKQTTADALPEIIEHYQAEGYTFRNYYEIFQ